MNNYDIPILMIIFNHPDSTQQVFAKVREIQPKYLYVVADGPRSNNPADVQKCQKVRSIVEQVDWDCNVQTLFREYNWGCEKSASDGISWFFRNVEKGIILEDDCVPHISFFSYCKNLLEYYYEDTRIMHISGNNFQKGIHRGDATYYFSRLPHIWGWATWRRAWNYYDIDMKTYPAFRKKIIKNIFEKKIYQWAWTDFFDIAYHKIGASNWDFKWTYAVMCNNGLCINPNNNLVSNIGFNADALHSKNSNHKLANIQTSEIKAITHPQFILADQDADDLTLRYAFNINYRNYPWKHLLRPIINKLKYKR